jgi:hypothetical protein
VACFLQFDRRIRPSTSTLLTKMKKLSTTLALAALLATAGAQAAPITFEGQANTQYNSPITRGGYLIGNVVGQEQHFHEVDSNQYGLASNGTGVLLNDRDTQIFVEEVGGLDFSLISVDVASSLASNNGGVGLVIMGYNNGAMVGQISLASLGNGFTTLNGASLGTIDRLVFDGIGGGGGFELDNLNLGPAANPVPEPTSVALVLLALGAAGVARRSRKA